MCRSSLLLLIVVAVLSTSRSSQAQSVVCSTNTLQAQCYANRTVCHYDGFAGVCATGAPTTCEAYWKDSTGCTSGTLGPRCAVNTFNGHCYTLPPVCTSLNTSQCSQRSDCALNSSATGCVTGAPAGTCGNATTAMACGSNCYWEVYLPTPRCFYNLQEVNLIYPCSFWTDYPDTNACGGHSCAVNGNLCSGQTSAQASADQGYTISSSFTFSIANPSVAPNSNILTATLIRPISQVWQPTNPMLQVFSIGMAPGDGTTALQQSTCNTLLGSQPPLRSGLPAASTYANQPSLLGTFISYVQANGNVDLDLGTPEGVAVAGIVGRARYGNTSFLQSTSIADGLQNVDDYIVADLDFLAANCNVTRVVSPTFTTYGVPIYLMTRQSGYANTDNQAYARTFLTVNKYTYGTIQIAANTYNPVQASFVVIHDDKDTCPSGQKRRFFTIRLDVSNVFDTTQAVGLRTPSDVTFHPPNATSTLTNCFGTSVVSVTPPTFPCTGGICTTFILFQTRCALIPVDGNGLNLCVNQVATNMAADLAGTGLSSYPGNLNYNHNFWFYTWSWNGTLGITDPAPSYVGSDPTGAAPDQLIVSISQPTSPDLLSISSTFTVMAGLMATPSDPVLSDLVVFVNTDTGANAIDLRDKDLHFDKTLTYVIQLPTQNERQTYTLSIDINNFKIFPLSSTGRVINNGLTYLTWAQIAPVLAATPRMVLCPTCFLPPVASQPGIDGFSVPVPWLLQLMPANGYRFQLGWSVTLPPINGTLVGQTIFTSPEVGGSASRRLLSVTDMGAAGNTSVNGTRSDPIMVDPLAYGVYDQLNFDLGTPRDVVIGKAVGGTLGGAVAVTTLAMVFAMLAMKAKKSSLLIV